MLALEQSPRMPGATIRCLRVDGSVGACDLSAIFIAVPGRASGDRCGYLLLSPFLNRPSDQEEKADNLRMPAGDLSSSGSQMKPRSPPPPHTMELPFGGFKLTGDLSFVPSHVHDFLGIRSAKEEEGRQESSASLVEEAFDHSSHHAHDYGYMCCLATTHCEERNGSELSAQGAKHCGEAANLWRLHTTTEGKERGQESGIKVVASSSGSCVIMIGQRVMLQSSQQGFGGVPCLSTRIVSMGVRSKVSPVDSPPTPMLTEDGIEAVTQSFVLGATNPSEPWVRARGVMLGSLPMGNVSTIGAVMN